MGGKKLQWESVQTIQLSEESFTTLCHSPAFNLGYVFFSLRRTSLPVFVCFLPVIFQPCLDLFHLSLIILFSLMHLLHVTSMSEVVISSLTFPTFKKMILMKGVNDTWGNQHH